jgi:hypothetical protein
MEEIMPEVASKYGPFDRVAVSGFSGTSKLVYTHCKDYNINNANYTKLQNSTPIDTCIVYGPYTVPGAK